MERGTVCVNSTPGQPVLGLQIQPGQEQQLEGILEFLRQPEAICRVWGLAADFSSYRARYERDKPTIQAAFYELDQCRPLTEKQRLGLSELVSPVKLEPDPKGRALLYLYSDPVEVFAQMTLELDLERGSKPARLCGICQHSIPIRYRSDRLTCSDGCALRRKRDADKARYRRRQTLLSSH